MELSDDHPYVLYVPHGGWNYAHPDVSDANSARAAVQDGDAFFTLERACTEWARRRADRSGRFPLWGDMDPDGYAVYSTNGAESFDAWTVEAVYLIAEGG